MTVRFTPNGPLALYASAFGAAPAPQTQRTAANVVSVRGPMMHHSDPDFDSYEAILDRLSAALTAPDDHVIFDIDSPGGAASGCMDAARRMRAMADAAGKRLIGYAGGVCASAGYALISACHEVIASPESMIGSIGVIESFEDVSQMLANMGTKVHFVVSGARKADGAFGSPVTDAMIASRQRAVDSLAGAFFDQVSGSRGIDRESIKNLQASLVTGVEALALGLVDAVGSIDQISIISEGLNMSAYDSALKALQKAAEGTDANAAAAKRALAAMAPPEDEGAEGEGEVVEETDDEAEAESTVAASAASNAGASATTEATVAAMAATIQQMHAVQTRELQAKAAAQKAEQATAERAALIASRADLAPTVVDWLRNPATPLDAVRSACASLPKADLPPVMQALAAAMPGNGASAPTPPRTTYGNPPRTAAMVGNVQIFGVPKQ